MLHVSVTGDRLMKSLEDALPTPTCEAFIDGIPVAVFFGKQSPLCAAASDPQDGFEEESAILLSSDVGVRM
jgi:hypothetical protein